MKSNTHSPQLREKLLTYGPQNLSDSELLAIVISSGSGNTSCQQLALELLSTVGDLRAILNCNYQTFTRIKGLGAVRYVQLQAAREICRRSDLICLKKDIRITSSQQSFHFLKRQLRDQRHEVFAVIFLDNQHRVLAFESLFQGSINSANVFIRPIIDRILALNAAAIIIAHNHPSGHCEPSQQDLRITEKIQQAVEWIDVRLLDHIVVGDNEVYSIMHQAKSTCA
ncbi:MAG: DNA repair protein RadC [Legionellaceae bacterium]|nr:DNA repair protein RadC [Legionellaceae bacterium]